MGELGFAKSAIYRNTTERITVEHVKSKPLSQLYFQMWLWFVNLRECNETHTKISPLADVS